MQLHDFAFWIEWSCLDGLHRCPSARSASDITTDFVDELTPSSLNPEILGWIVWCKRHAKKKCQDRVIEVPRRWQVQRTTAGFASYVAKNWIGHDCVQWLAAFW